MLDKSITERLSKDKTSRKLHFSGLLTILANLSTDLEELLYEEKRFFGRAKQYMISIDNIFKTILIDDGNENRKTYNRVKYLYKPILINTFDFLQSKRLSKADCVIVIMNRFLNVLDSYDTEWKEPIKECKTIITNLFDNIKYNTKYSNLSTLTNSINDLISMNALGKYELDYITVQKAVKQEENNNKKKEEKTKSNKTTKISEVEL